ncbi:hypothetical protein BCV70DRAFT_232428 [Testicularia cyperi]|uniref:Uncharacterized protein n=1 Tax=Testicularia cyperi TaxID=1882483 RepID=A0A317XNT8_9BASI|nr:hypothetical protein BCV70DRAFT_232428 [Testicularia cyperi]
MKLPSTYLVAAFFCFHPLVVLAGIIPYELTSRLIANGAEASHFEFDVMKARLNELLAGEEFEEWILRRFVEGKAARDIAEYKGAVYGQDWNEYYYKMLPAAEKNAKLPQNWNSWWYSLTRKKQDELALSRSEVQRRN